MEPLKLDLSERLNSYGNKSGKSDMACVQLRREKVERTTAKRGYEMNINLNKAFPGTRSKDMRMQFSPLNPRVMCRVLYCTFKGLIFSTLLYVCRASRIGA